LICFGANRGLKRAAARRAAEAAAQRDPENVLRAGGTADGETVHTLYFIPLGAWGWMYGIAGLLFTVGAVGGVIKRGWRE
jgi:hypothetical protein